MTYLDIVNKVLRRLREREVTSVSSTAYSKLIGDFVNDAKREVENAWEWSALRTTLTLTSSANMFNYELQTAQNNFSILDVVNDTSNTFMQYQSSAWFDNAFLNQTAPTGAPLYYNWNGFSSDGDATVDIYPVPNGVYSIRFNCVLRSTDVTTDSSTILVPHQPIVLLAWAKAIEERGEDGGASSMNAYAAGKASLADEIAFDAARRPEETVWCSV